MKTLQVLPAEDDGLIGDLPTEMLKAMGHDVCAVVVAKAAAVTAAAQHRPDLIIADVRLGPDCGNSASEEILRGGVVPHLFITGSISAATALRPDAVILEKPFDAAQLAYAIQRASAITATPFPAERA